VKLLRVLQQKEFTPLGGNRKVPLKARVLLATHRNLEAMVEDGEFRRDLFFRVNVMKIEMPSLRDRTEDIPLLANSFLRRYAESCRRPVARIESRAMRALLTHDWPGNIRELENIIHRAVILADTDAIKLEDLPPGLQPQTTANETGQLQSYDEVMRDFKRTLAVQTLQECKGNKTKAAVSLNISRAYLHRLLRPADSAAS
jgi:DNA-binding NtrC family response regulator